MLNKKRVLAFVTVLVLAFSAMSVLATEHKHDWSAWKVQTDATCTQSGTSVRTCSVSGCDKGGIEYDYNSPAAKGHTWGSYKQTTAPSCTKEGVETRTCEVCKETETRTLAKIPHDIVPWRINSGKVATCLKEGEEITYCNNCDEMTETRVVPKLSHNWGDWNPKPGALADCTTDGTKIRYCSLCGSSDEQAVTKLGHTFGAWFGNPDPTCTADGMRQQICSRCGFINEEPVNKLGHSFGAWTAGDTPTCVKAGSKSRVCSRCSEKETESVAALGKNSTVGHSFTDWGTTKAPTCSAEGVQKRTCKNGCGREETRDVEKIAHTSDEKWVTLEEGSLSRRTKQATTCKVCGQAAKTRSVAAKGIKMEQRTFAYGPLAGQANPSLGGSDVRLVWLDLTTNATYTFPLVTPDPLNVGRAVITVSGGSVRVSLEKNSETASLLRYRVWQAFPDAQSVNLGKLDQDSLPFDQAVPLPGDSAVIVVQTLANYYTSGVNTVFSEAALGWDNKSYKEINDEMLLAMGVGE